MGKMYSIFYYYRNLVYNYFLARHFWITVAFNTIIHLKFL